MRHQAALLIRGKMMFTLVTGEARKHSYIFFRKRPLPTKIGGDLNFIAQEMTFQFHRPVFAGDTVHCEVTLDELELGEKVTRVASTWVCRNQHGKEVMTGQARGVIRN